jgi:hypothetical protein
VKIVVAGVVSAMLATFIAFASTVALAVLQLMRMEADGGGLGAVSAGVTESAFLAAPVGFLIGCYVQARRSRPAKAT